MRTILWPKILRSKIPPAPRVRRWPCGWTVTVYVFRNCRFLGWQDTIFGNRGRHYYENCYIAGAVDFIFGGATEFYEHCHIHCLGNGYITAASTPADHPFGYVFSHCQITGENPDVKTYLGRPWRAYASVTFLNTEMSGVVRPSAGTTGGTRHVKRRRATPNSTAPARVRIRRRVSNGHIH